METRFLKRPRPIRRPGAGALFLVLAAFVRLKAAGAETPENTREPFFTWDLLLAGSWENSFGTGDPPQGQPKEGGVFSGGTLTDRGDFRLSLPGPDLSFRFLATDKRILPPEEDDPKAGFNPGLGVYHRLSGSRFLYGIQSEYGLPARIRNVWLHQVPFTESRGPQTRDLKTEPSAKDTAETYLYLGLPPLGSFGAFASAALDGEQNPALGAGLGLAGIQTELRLEGFYARKELPRRTAKTWFSLEPPLPERDFNIYALAFIFNSRYAAIASDWALSETSAWGRGVYGNSALRLGDKPWRFSLAGDGAGGRFSDRDGSAAGTGFRVAAKAERFWPRSGLLRFQGNFQAPALGGIFERGSLSLYFRPPAPRAGTAEGVPFRFTRASFGISRDARTPEKAAGSLDGVLGFRLFFFNASLSCALRGFSSLDAEAETLPLFQPVFFETFESFKITGDLGWRLLGRGAWALDFRAKLGYTGRAEKEPVWNPGLSCSVKPGRWGRFSLKIASPDFPEKWEYSLSWRFEL